MIKLVNKTNVITTDTDYLLGKIKDDTGIGDGTPVNAEVYNDMHQFFERIMQSALITANNLPDNSTNGYQLYDALLGVINQPYMGLGGITYSGSYAAHPTNPIRLRKGGNNQIRIKGKIYNPSLSTVVNVSTPIFTIPFAGFRPQQTQLLTVASADSSRPVVVIEVNSSGVVSIRGDLTPVTDILTYMNLSYEND